MNESQLITLLRISRRSFNGKKRRGSDLQDVAYLQRRGLIEEPDDDGAQYLTIAGADFIKKLLANLG